MPSINNIVVGDTYDSTTPPATLQDVWTCNGGWFSVSGQSAFMEAEYGVLGASYWTEETLVGNGAFGTFGRVCKGLRFRNAVAGKSAQITVYMAQGDEPAIDISSLGTVNLSGTLNLGTGDPQQVSPAYNVTAGTLISIVDGSVATPDTSLLPPVKVSRLWHHVTADVSPTDGASNLSGISSDVIGDSTSQVQSVGVYGAAGNSGTTKGAVDSPDACGLYGRGRITGSGIGVGIGAYLEGRKDTTTANITGVQVAAGNFSGADTTYSPSVFNDCSIFNVAYGNNKTAVGLFMAQQFGVQFDVGIAFSSQVHGGLTGPVATTSIQDDGNSVNSIVINGTHSGYGIDLNGGTFLRPIRLPQLGAIVGRNAANSADVLIVRVNASNLVEFPTGLISSGTSNVAISGTGGLTFGTGGVNIGFDTVTGSKIGTATTQKLAFWNAAPIVQPQLSTGVGHTVDDVITTLQTLGLCHQ